MNTLDLSITENRHFILQISLKCADISNPTRPWDISHKWSLKVCDEFFRQGEFERKLNLPVTSICDQQSTSIAKIQSGIIAISAIPLNADVKFCLVTGFFKFVVTPLFCEWHRFLKSTLSTHMMVMLDSNRRRWEAQEVAENAEETQTELSDAEQGQDVSEDESSKESKAISEAATIVDFFPPPLSPPINK